MIHKSAAINSLETLDLFLLENGHLASAAKSVLAQVFSGICDPEWIGRVCYAITRACPGAVIAGATTGGEICAERYFSSSTIVSLSFFDSSSLALVSSPLKPGEEARASELLEKAVVEDPGPVKGALLFTTPDTLNCNALLGSIHGRMPGLPLFGGCAAALESDTNPHVFCGDMVCDAGFVAVLFRGADLRMSREVFLGWTPAGRIMTITKSEGQRVFEIDGMPAFEVYRKYLGIEDLSQIRLSSMEFPLLIHRGGHLIASSAFSAHEDESVTYSLELKKGEQVQFSYAHIDTIIEGIGGLLQRLGDFAPEALYVYSCFTRRFLLQEDIEIEIKEFNNIAPSAGFFTGGEICNLGDMAPLLTVTTVLAALAEGAARPESYPVGAGHVLEVKDRVRLQMIRRFRHFLHAATQDLVAANEELKRRMDEINRLRDIIPICSCCKKIRDDKGYWNQLEIYLREHSNMEFSHGLCPDCLKRLYPDIADDILSDE
jgi:hypothetical protein